MDNIVRLFEAGSGIKADKFKALNDLESVFKAMLNKDLQNLFLLEQEISDLNESIYNSSDIDRRMDFERVLNKAYKAYSLALAKVAVRVDKHFTNRLETMRGL